jgi:hypothetical protein
MVAPTPFNTVRREMCFLKRFIAISNLYIWRSGDLVISDLAIESPNH